MEKGVPIRSISRSINVLQIINRRGSWTLKDIAEEASIPYPSISRIVNTLVCEGLIEREPRCKHYRPTAMVQTLAYGFQGSHRLPAAARSFIVDLTKKIGWPISLTIHVGQSMVVTDSTHSMTTMKFDNYEPGFSLPLLECASGRAFIAFSPPEEREILLKSLRMTVTEKSLCILNLFESGHLVEIIRTQEYASRERNPYTSTPRKTSSIAVPILNKGTPIGALTLIFFSSALKVEDAAKSYLSDLKYAARGISDSLV